MKAEACRQQARALYARAQSGSDAFERLNDILQAIACEDRAAEFERLAADCHCDR